jgi:hypothetical protein
VISSDDDGGHLGGPNTASYNYLTAERQAHLRAGGADLRRPLDRRLAPVRVGAGQRPPRGRAIDVMTWSNRSLGWRIANWAVANAWALDVKYVIFNGRIWTRSRGWHGYRHPSDPCNCNPTLRHDDHVHISVL